MPRRKRQASTFNLSFLDIMSCGFGAVVLVFLIIDHSLEIEIQTVNAEVLSEVNLLEDDIREGEAGLVRLRNALDEADLEIVEADGLARRITEDLDEYEALIAAIEESGLSDTDVIAKLQAEINQLEEKIQLLEEAAEAEAGRSARICGRRQPPVFDRPQSRWTPDSDTSGYLCQYAGQPAGKCYPPTQHGSGCTKASRQMGAHPRHCRLAHGAVTGEFTISGLHV